jgi:predicted acetyltransferase
LEIRPITAEDYEAHRHIISLAFYRGKMPEFTTEIYEQPDRTRIGVFENGRVQAALGILDFEFYFGEDRRPCGGIFGVASDPAMRGRGFAGALLTRSLEIMRDRGQYLSSLWPFDFRYYRGYGWEWAGETRNYTIPLELLPATGEADYVEGVYEPAIPLLDSIYERMANRYHGMAARTLKRWEQLTGPAGGRQRAAYLYRRDGEPEGYALLRYGDKDDELHADELVALTPRAYAGLLGVARRHAMTAKKLIYSAPMDDMLRSIQNHWDVETKIEPAGMARVVDARAALQAVRPEAGVRGEAVVLLADERAPWNAGTWLVAVEDGRVEVTRTDKEAGVALDIQALTQAYWGSPSLLELWMWDRVDVRNEAQFALLSSVLTPWPVWLHDDF